MRMHLVIGWTSLPVLLLVAGSVLAGRPTAISDCDTSITEPGKYRLANDLLDCTEVGVIIYSSDVTLDLKGHTISCADNGLRSGGAVTWGEENQFIRNVKIRNGKIAGCSDGILLRYTEDSKVWKITASGSRVWDDPDTVDVEAKSGTGITVWLSRNNVIMHNHTYGNESLGIGSWESSGNLFKHNASTDNGGGWVGTGIDLTDETNSRIMCNRISGNVDGILLAPGSNGNLLRGNVVVGNSATGIGMMGFAWDGYYWLDIPAENTVRSNVVEGNGWFDFFELYYDLVTDDMLPHPEGACMNNWEKNQFGPAVFGPEDCFGVPFMLDDDDVCAQDEDD